VPFGQPEGGVRAGLDDRQRERQDGNPATRVTTRRRHVARLGVVDPPADRLAFGEAFRLVGHVVVVDGRTPVDGPVPGDLQHPGVRGVGDERVTVPQAVGVTWPAEVDAVRLADLPGDNPLVVLAVEFNDPVVVAVGHEHGVLAEPLGIVLVVEQVGVATPHVTVTVLIGELSRARACTVVLVGAVLVDDPLDALAALDHDELVRVPDGDEIPTLADDVDIVDVEPVFPGGVRRCLVEFAGVPLPGGRAVGRDGEDALVLHVGQEELPGVEPLHVVDLAVALRAHGETVLVDDRIPAFGIEDAEAGVGAGRLVGATLLVAAVHEPGHDRAVVQLRHVEVAVGVRDPPDGPAPFVAHLDGPGLVEARPTTLHADECQRLVFPRDATLRCRRCAHAEEHDDRQEGSHGHSESFLSALHLSGLTPPGQ